MEGVSGVGLILGPTLGATFYSFGGFSAPFYFLGGYFLLSSIFTLSCISKKVE